MAVLMTHPYLTFFDDNGNPLSGGKVYTYEAGTTTPKATYTDSAEGTENANPVILDVAGRPSSSGTPVGIWLSGSYNFKVTDSDDVEIRTVENVTAFVNSPLNISALSEDTPDYVNDLFPFEDVSDSNNSKKAVLAPPISVLAGGALAEGNYQGISRIINASAVSVSHTGDTNETTLATITVPAGALGANGYARIHALFTTTNSVNDKTLKIKFGGTTYSSIVTTSSASYAMMCFVHNRNSASSQVGTANSSAGFGPSTALITSAVNTANAVDIIITAQLESAGESITLEARSVEIMYKA